jgi:hypothetical protein
MATQQDIEAKRAKIEALREQIAEEKQAAYARDAEANADYQMQRLDAEEKSLAEQLATLRASAPAKAAPTTKPSSDDAANTKE